MRLPPRHSKGPQDSACPQLDYATEVKQCESYEGHSRHIDVLEVTLNATTYKPSAGHLHRHFEKNIYMSVKHKYDLEVKKHVWVAEGILPQWTGLETFDEATVWNRFSLVP